MARTKKITLRVSDEEFRLIRAEAYRRKRDMGPHVYELLKPKISKLRRRSAEKPETEAA